MKDRGIKSAPRTSAQFTTSLGAYSEKIIDPQEIIPAIQRAQELNRSGRTVLLEFITKEEGEYSKFQFR